MTAEWSVIKEACEEAPALVPAVASVSSLRGIMRKPWIGYDDNGTACLGFECRTTVYPWSAVIAVEPGESWCARVYTDRVEVEQLRGVPSTTLMKIIHRETMPLRRFVRSLERCSLSRRET